MIVAFAGWPDAAEVATGALRYAISQTGATRLGTIAGEPFYDFHTSRPFTLIEQGELKHLRLTTTTELSFHIDEPGSHDFIFLSAIEPQLRWETYVRQVMRVVEEFDVTRVIGFGSMYDMVPHTKEALISGVASTAALRSLLRTNGLAMINYHGPSSIHTLLQQACQARSVESVSLWGHTPFYVRAPANPRVCCALLDRLSLVSPLAIDLSDLRIASDFLSEALRRLMAENTAIRLYVRHLEEQYESGLRNNQLSDENTEQIIRDVENFLRREQHRQDGNTD